MPKSTGDYRPEILAVAHARAEAADEQSLRLVAALRGKISDHSTIPEPNCPACHQPPTKHVHTQAGTLHETFYTCPNRHGYALRWTEAK